MGAGRLLQYYDTSKDSVSIPYESVASFLQMMSKSHKLTLITRI
jgi:hypothetical protein